MEFWRQVNFSLGIASALCALGLAWRLASQRLRTVYPWLFAFVLFDAARTLATIWFRPGTNAGAYLYMATEPAVWILNLMMIREIFHQVLADHPGIDSISRRFIRYGAAAAAAISAALLSMDYASVPGLPGILRAVFVSGRVVLVILVVLLAAGVAFMSWFPVKIARNASVLLTGYAVYFGSKALLLLFRNLAGNSFNLPGGMTIIVITIACLLAGTFLLTQAHQTRDREFRHKSGPEETERLLAQLARMNRKLEQSVRT